MSEEQKSIPTKHYKVSCSKDCPEGLCGCDGCISGERVSYNAVDNVRRIYDVSECYKLYIYKKLLEKSGVKGRGLKQTFENCKYDVFNKGTYAALKKWDYKQGKGIYIAAKKDTENNPQGNGTGKTYGLYALAHRLCKEGVACLFSSTVGFFMEIRSTYSEFAKENEMMVMDKYINVPVLLWDDIGKESFNHNSDWAPEKIYYIIDERHKRRKPIVFSSNFKITELEARFGKDNYGPAIVSRLLEHCDEDSRIALGGLDRRFQK